MKFPLGCQLNKIEFYGNKRAVEKTQRIIATIKDVEHIPEPMLRIAIQDLIDQHNLRANITLNNNQVWSKKRILINLRRIMETGRLYGEKEPGRHLVAGVMWLPIQTDPVLSKYFYEFIHLDCGSIAHYDIHGWIAEYPTLEKLKKFFKKNELGYRVLDYIPSWHTDAKLIVEAIETLLFPIESYIRARRK